mgnify:CR=1 FL=1
MLCDSYEAMCLAAELHARHLHVEMAVLHSMLPTHVPLLRRRHHINLQVDGRSPELEACEAAPVGHAKTNLLIKYELCRARERNHT